MLCCRSRMRIYLCGGYEHNGAAWRFIFNSTSAGHLNFCEREFYNGSKYKKEPRIAPEPQNHTKNHQDAVLAIRINLSEPVMEIPHLLGAVIS